MIDRINEKLERVFTNSTTSTRIYASDDEIDTITRDPDYGTEKYPRFCFGITFVEGAPNYEYKLRFNITINRRRSEGPSTQDDITT